MENNKLDKIINIIREEMMTTGSTPGKPGFSSAAPAQRAQLLDLILSWVR